MVSLLLPLVAIGAACAGGSPPPSARSTGAASPASAAAVSVAPLAVEVAGLAPESTLPVVHTCDGADRSPVVRWSAGPPQTVSYAIVVDDPDAPVGTWVHWTAWGIPPTSTMLAGGISPKDGGLVQGLNDFQQVGWGGPCPPPGHGPHRYYFRVYALDVALSLSTGASRAELDAAMSGHIQAQGEWMGRYERK